MTVKLSFFYFLNVFLVEGFAEHGSAELGPAAAPASGGGGLPVISRFVVGAIRQDVPARCSKPGPPGPRRHQKGDRGEESSHQLFFCGLFLGIRFARTSNGFISNQFVDLYCVK